MFFLFWNKCIINKITYENQINYFTSCHGIML
jgi:hypothetical protein